MALSKKALQRKREKKQIKRKKREGSPLKNVSTPHSWPVYECWVSTDLWEEGIGYVIVVHKSNRDDIAMGVFLIDTFCLGIKNCFARLTNLYDYKAMLDRIWPSHENRKQVEPSYAATLIYKAKEYAQGMGLKPHADFSKAEKFLNGIIIENALKFNFGKNGKPFYVQGPKETQRDVKNILSQLETNVGQGNYDFMMTLSQPTYLT